MEDLLIKQREIGDYRIKVYYDINPECPCLEWDMVWNFLWEYGMSHSISDTCNWQEVYGKFGNSDHTLDESVIQLIEDYVGWEDLVQYFKDGKVKNYRLRNSEGSWYLEWYNAKKDVYEEIDVYEDCELSENLVGVSELLASLRHGELVQILNDLGNDIIVRDFDSSGYSQGEYVKGIAFCTKDWFEKNAPENIGNWKEEALEYLDGSIKTVEMWMWGDVKGFVLERKASFTKVYDDPDREDEKGHEWEKIDSCWGYYTSADELIDEVIDEHDLKEIA